MTSGRRMSACRCSELGVPVSSVSTDRVWQMLRRDSRWAGVVSSSKHRPRCHAATGPRQVNTPLAANARCTLPNAGW